MLLSSFHGMHCICSKLYLWFLLQILSQLCFLKLRLKMVTWIVDRKYLLATRLVNTIFTNESVLCIITCASNRSSTRRAARMVSRRNFDSCSWFHCYYFLVTRNNASKHQMLSWPVEKRLVLTFWDKMWSSCDSRSISSLQACSVSNAAT